MVYTKGRLLAVAAAALMVAGGCSSSSKSGSGTAGTGSAGGTTAGSSSGSGKTITVGVLTDLTGAGANISSTFPQGVKAGIGLAAKDGYNIKYVTADSGTSPAGELAGAQKLVLENHVYAVIASSVLLFSAAKFLADHGIPVFGPGADGDEWITTPSMLSILGYQDYTKVYTMFGDFFKSRGVTNLASVGYSIEPSSKENAEENAASAQHAGIKVGYLNTSFPLGSTNVGPLVLAMKAAGIDGLTTSIVTNSSFAIVNGLKQQGVNLKVNMLPTGYGGDLIQGGAGAERSAQGSYFLTGAEPVELHTAATEQFQNALKTYAGVTGDPTFSEYNGYLAMAALEAGLKAGGTNQSQAQLINTMLNLKGFDGRGLWGGHKLSFAMADRGTISSIDNCIWFEQYVGSAFIPIKGFSPLCGSVIPGLTVPK
jgi:ABC-type branched-subunit amino acid transport system substrate-binding protein